MKKYFAEFVGTGLFTLVVTLSLTGHFGAVATPVLAALTLGLLVYFVGHLSGAHLNPAVTIGLWSVKKINPADTLKYLVAQFLGAGVSYFLARALVSPALLSAPNSTAHLLGEFIGAIIFTFGVAAVATGRVPVDASGVGVGGALLLGLSVAAAVGSNAVLNPAMALAIGSFSWGYALAPVAGGIVGMQLFHWLAKE